MQARELVAALKTANTLKYTKLDDPGDAGTIKLDDRSHVYVPLASGASGETRTLSDPRDSGDRIMLFHKTDGGGTITVTASSAYDEAGNTTLAFDDVGEFVDLVAIEDGSGTFAWRIVGYDGVTGPAVSLDDISADTVTVTGATDLGGTLTLSDGGTVTQITSITTGVTLNTNSGQITTVSSTLAAAAEATFTVTNSQVSATDTVIANIGSTSSTGTPVALVTAIAAGSFDITLSNLHASAALNNTVTINFAVVGGASS